MSQRKNVGAVVGTPIVGVVGDVDGAKVAPGVVGDEVVGDVVGTSDVGVKVVINGNPRSPGSRV